MNEPAMCRRCRIRVVLLVGLLALAAAPSGAATSFPQPDGIVPNVDFWTRVYSEVGTSGGLIHDSRKLSVVYEVLRNAPGTSDRTLDRQKKKAKERYVAILKKLASGKRSGLGADEQRVLALFPDGVSNKELRAAAGRVRFQRGQANKFKDGIRRMGRWEGFIRQALRERGLPTELVALPHVESSYNPKALSHVGASGIWQFTRGTGRRFMQVDHVVDERRDPFLASVAAARLLAENYDALGAWPLAITAYNHGAGGMKRAVRQLGTRDIGVISERYQSRSFGFASRNFYSEFLAALRVQENANQYFGAIRKDPPTDPEILALTHYYSVKSLSRALEVGMDDLREHNLALLTPIWAGQKRVPKGYALRLPRRPTVAAATTLLANVPSAERHGEQIRDRRYRVRRGDTISGIAKRFGVRQSEIVALNGLRSSNRIRSGQILEIPGHAGAAPSTATKTAIRAAAPEPAPADGLYRIRRGDSLDSIAKRFGVTVGDLASANRIRNRHRISAGQVIEIPGGSKSAKTEVGSPGGVYTVRKGDSLHSIARRFGTTEEAIASLNGIQNRHRIKAGQTLYLPSGS